MAWPSPVGGEYATYGDTLRSLFEYLASGLDAVTIIEHDVESRSGCLRAYEDCPRPWCYHAYDFSQPYEESVPQNFAPLGHVRFRRELAPALLEVAALEEWGAHGYQHLDRLLYERITTEHAIGPHRHPGKVFHHHDYASERV